MMSLGSLIQSYFYWRSCWRWFHPQRKRQLELILENLDQIDITGRVVLETARVERKPAPPRPFTPSDEYLWRKERENGRQTAPY